MLPSRAWVAHPTWGRGPKARLRSSVGTAEAALRVARLCGPHRLAHEFAQIERWRDRVVTGRHREPLHLRDHRSATLGLADEIGHQRALIIVAR